MSERSPFTGEEVVELFGNTELRDLEERQRTIERDLTSARQSRWEVETDEAEQDIDQKIAHLESELRRVRESIRLAQKRFQ